MRGSGLCQYLPGQTKDFSDHESDSVIFAGDCPGCTKPPNAYRLGISTLTTKGQPGINDTLPGDPEGEWSFIDSAHRQIVPFDKGYYAEFRASHFSTYYFNNGGLHDTSYLPVQMSLTATRMNDHTAMLNWTTASEINIEQFDVQVAKGDSALQIRDFRSIGTVQSKGRSAQTQSYDFTDPGLHGDDHYYYRIRATDIYGHPGYSPIMKLNVDEEKPVQIYPNPSSGLFTIRYFAAVGELLTVNVYNSTGMMLKTESLTGKGYTQTTPLNLANAGFPDGVYFVKVSGKSGTQMFRLVKVN